MSLINELSNKGQLFFRQINTNVDHDMTELAERVGFYGC